MTSHELLLRMTDSSAPTPMMTNMVAVYAVLVASVADRLASHELESFVALGIAMQRQGHAYIPVTPLE
ncbi:MAG: hypothetical protein EOO32_01255 [Comamonadaceae bacterium]|nr:MAG: hypothetical protein EOO32_01255 [Comamonadaceae bacterium]